MKKSKKLVTPELLKTKEKEILKEWMGNILSSTKVRLDLIDKGVLEEQSSGLLKKLINATSTGNMEDITAKEYEPVISFIKGISRDYAARGFTPSETVIYVLSFKYALTKFLKSEYKENLYVYAEETEILSKLIDEISMITIDDFVKGKEEQIQEQVETMMEMETPVLRIEKGALLVPIIGTLDSNRAQKVMDKMLQSILETESKVVILDITGVPAVDTAVANHILKMSKSAKLMGCTCIVSGVVPAVAQSIVNLGVEMGDLITKSSLKDAVISAFEYLKLEIVEKKESSRKKSL